MFSSSLMRFAGASSFVAYNAAGGGYGDTGNPTYTIAVAANSYVVVFVSVDRNIAITGVTCGGAAMTQLQTVTHNGSTTNGYQTAYGLAVSASGSKTIAVTMASTGASWQISNAVSYTGVSAVQASPATATGSGTPSVSGTCTPGQMIVAAISRSVIAGGSGLAPSGGTSRYNATGGGLTYIAIAIADSTSNMTLSSTGTGINWGGIALVLT